MLSFSMLYRCNVLFSVSLFYKTFKFQRLVKNK